MMPATLNRFLVFVILLLWMGGTVAAQETASPPSNRSVAVTFDDLPATRSGSLEYMQAVTTQLLGHIETLGIPAMGFVNEAKLDAPGEEAARAALLEAWLDAGLELGNHTYAHLRLYNTPLAEMEADVLRGEQVTRPLMEARGMRLRYFRHPTLNTGPDLETKTAFEAFLAGQGYTVAPVTIDNDEYLYAAAYDRAQAQGDAPLMERIGTAYIRYMEDVFGFYEQLSKHLLGREVSQVLLLHANALNAAYFDTMVAMMRARGYRFVSLDEALADPAYGLPDTYVGSRGISWLQRWAITRGQDPGSQPSAPAWIQEAARGV